jgi:hypothetical protein
MDSSISPLDAFAFLVFAILIAVAVIVIVKLGQLPGQLARKWGHPQAAAINLDRDSYRWLALAACVHLGVHNANRLAALSHCEMSFLAHRYISRQRSKRSLSGG